MISSLTKNAGLKLLALGIAFVLWALVSGEQEAQRVFTVPLDFDLPSDRILSGRTPTTAQVRIRGPESILRGVVTEDLAIRVDLPEGAPRGRFIVELGPKNVRGVPSGTAVESIIPENLAVAVEARSAREVPVSARLVGSLAPGFKLGGVEIRPDRVTVEGPQSEIEQVAIIYTDPIALHGRREPFTVSSPLAVGNPRLHLVDGGPVTVTLNVVREGRSG